MSDQRPTPQTVRETSSNGGILFVLGAIVVAIGLLLWYVVGGNTTPSATPVTKTNITIEAPAAAKPDPAATAPAATAPAANAPATTAPAAPATPAPAAPAAP